MSYQVLARKYRPLMFDDVVAQEHVTTTLRNAITSARIGSGYLFCGPRGTGKTSVARILARSINCAEGPTVTPCGKCDSCTSIGLESSLDVREIDAASNTSVDDVRALRENVRYGPSAENRKKIYIIDEVHRLSGPAFDALLKTLEEPPPHVMFIFATTDPQKVPDTIHSRTQRFDFRRVTIRDLTPALGAIAKSEGFKIDADALRLIARRGDGSVRDSISLLDQLMSFSSGEVTAELVVTALGLVDQEFVFKFVEELAAGECANALTMIAELSDNGADIKEFAQELAEHYRTLTLIKSLGARAKNSSALDLNDEELARYDKQVEFYSIGDLVRISEILSETLLSMKGLDPRWMLEIAVIKIAHLESTIQLEEIISHLEIAGAGSSGSPAPTTATATATAKSDRDLFNGADSSSETTSDTQSQPTQSRAAQYAPAPRTNSAKTTFKRQAPAAPSQKRTGVDTPRSATTVASINLPKIEHGWPKFLESLRGKSRMLGSQLSMAAVSEVKGNHIIAAFPPSGRSNMGLVVNPNYARQVEAALEEFYGAPLSIEYKIGQAPAREESAHTSNEGAPPNAAELLAEDATLKKVVERLDGEIVTVRKMKNSG